ncbi:MAG: T9SS type A sorting domain-containing protein, partial [Flavobacteriales bacterium]
APINDTCYLSYPPTHVQQPSRMDAASWSCWPNPVRDHLFIQAEPRLIGQSYEIRSMLGQVVLKGTVQRETNIIDMASWPTGIYIVRLNDDTRGVRIAKVD